MDSTVATDSRSFGPDICSPSEDLKPLMWCSELVSPLIVTKQVDVSPKEEPLEWLISDVRSVAETQLKITSGECLGPESLLPTVEQVIKEEPNLLPNAQDYSSVVTDIYIEKEQFEETTCATGKLEKEVQNVNNVWNSTEERKPVKFEREEGCLHLKGELSSCEMSKQKLGSRRSIRLSCKAKNSCHPPSKAPVMLFKRETCDKVSNHLASFREHQRILSGEHPFKCKLQRTPHIIIKMAEGSGKATDEKSVRLKSSKAWEHFTLNAAKKVVTCKICNTELVWHRSTTVMHEHMKRKHVDFTQEGETSGRKKQRTMTEFVQQNPQCTPQQTALITDSILKMLVADMRPLSMAEDQGFKSMLQRTPHIIIKMAEGSGKATAEKSVRPKSSKAWEHFTLNAAKEVVTCKICNTELVWHGSTTVMHEHMKRKHVGFTQEGETSGRKKQPTMTEFVQQNPQCTPQQAALITDSILKMLVADMRPLSMVEDQGFKSMVSVLNPGYTLPSRTDFTKLVERKYQEAFQNVKHAISANDCRIAFTADIWTSVATEAYLGITCHYIGDDWKLSSLCLTTMPLEDRHTAANIAEWIEEVAAKFEIPDKKIIAIVHDGSANIVAAVNILEDKHGWASICCTGHTLQLVINASLKHSGIQRAVSAARGLVEHFKKSELASNKLKEKQRQMGTPEHKLLQDVSTRWNSTYYMVDSLIEQRWLVTATLSDPSVNQKGKHLELKPEQWNLLEELSTALKPFECATVFMSCQEYVTVSSIPALVKGLLRSNEVACFESSPLKSFQATVTDQLQSRWKGILFENVPNTVVISSALDPRFRRLKFLTPEQIISVQAKVQTEALAVRREMVQQETTSSPVMRVDVPSTSAASLLDSLLESGGSSEKDTREGKLEEEDIHTQVRNEVQAYFAERPLAKERNPLNWWNTNQEKYPTLAKLAKSYLCIPGTSTPSERLFSAAGNIACKKRASLSPEHVDMLTFLHSNAKFLEQ
ncbi:E3 SUMO-protein ligase ZBED1-like [Spea bombifrons]|uniref:E3 SUMO-protein ligase ZBED1-like n=1 Tax=Spea bombifrons TaxID=233779 RepID=UPI00234B8678|nr:E3 SUMO-protein ligase ZBED1-like [Spea bombifrons]